jgi:hypothetical protein
VRTTRGAATGRAERMRSGAGHTLARCARRVDVESIVVFGVELLRNDAPPGATSAMA